MVSTKLVAILDDWKSVSIAFLVISDQYATFILLEFFSAKWPPGGHFGWPKFTFTTENHFPSHFSPFQINMAAGGHFGWPKNHFRSHFSPFQINTQLFFFKMATSGHFGSPILRQKTIGFFHYVLSMASPNMKLIGEFMTKLETPQAFWAFLYKMAGRGHFVIQIDAKIHRVLVIWDLNRYGEYEFDWCICDKVMACTSVGVRRRRNQKHNITEIFTINLDYKLV